MQNFRTLHLAIQLYQLSKPLRLKSYVKDQLERALLSVCLNLKEGDARLTQKDRRRFFNIALGSLREAQLIIELERLESLREVSDQCGAHLYKLIGSFVNIVNLNKRP